MITKKTLRILLGCVILLVSAAFLYGILIYFEQAQVKKDREAEVAKTREQICAQFSPEVGAKLLSIWNDGTGQEVITVIRNGVPDDVNRITIGFRILGLDNRAYGAGGGIFEGMTHYCLSDINDSNILAAINKLDCDNLAKKGAFRWLLKNSFLNLDPDERGLFLQRLVPVAFSTENQTNQRYIVKQLKIFGDKTSMGLLDEILKGKLKLAEDSNDKSGQ